MTSNKSKHTRLEKTPHTSPKSNSGTSGLGRDRKALTWGFIGIIAILVAVLVEESYHPTRYPLRVLLQFLGHIGIAFLLLGIVGVSLEFKNWRTYFEARLADTLQKKEFLRTVGNDQLKVLLKQVFLAYYKVEDLDRNSFYEFFSTKIQDFIGSPFREDTLIEITVPPLRRFGESFVAEIDQSYTCRRIPAEGALLQKEIKYFVDEEDLDGPFEAYKIILRLPEEKPKTFSIPEDFELFLSDDNTITLDSAETSDSDETDAKKNELFARKKELFKKLVKENPEPKGHGFMLSLEPFQTLECLDVQLYLKVALKVERFVAWEMTHPSLGFKAIFHYPPDDFSIQVENFGMDGARLNHPVNRRGTYSLTYDSWLLPTTGLAFRFMRTVESASANVAETYDRWSAELAAERTVLPHRG